MQSIFYAVKDMPWLASYKYTGEVDQSNKPCGFGIAIEPMTEKRRYEGTFFKGKLHGICELFYILRGILSIFIS